VVESEIIEGSKQTDEIIGNIKPIEEKVEAEAMVSVETPIIETTVVGETTIKNETNTYKKKKNKYKVHE
jgi:hypothetical protein